MKYLPESRNAVIKIPFFYTVFNLLQPTTKKMCPPYVRGTTCGIGRILKRNEVETIIQPAKLRHLIRLFKDELSVYKPAVQEIPCSCGSV